MSSHTKDTLAKARRAADKLGIPSLRRHILLCVDTKAADCAPKKEMNEAWQFLKKRLKELKLDQRGGVMRTRTGCLDICKGGPIAVVYPDGVWYGGCRPEVLERIIQEHLVEGRVVEEFVIARSQCGGE